MLLLLLPLAPYSAQLPQVEGVDELVMFEAAVELLLLEEADEPLLQAELG